METKRELEGEIKDLIADLNKIKKEANDIYSSKRYEDAKTIYKMVSRNLIYQFESAKYSVGDRNNSKLFS